MCDLSSAAGLPPLSEDEYVLDTKMVRSFVESVRSCIADGGPPERTVKRIEPLFAALLGDSGWLPRRYQEPATAGSMGGGIGQWLLFRAADRSLCLFSLVVPAGSMTPIHDHLAWGLVGVYRGTQDEEFYRPRGRQLGLLRARPLQTGDYYAIFPPTDDIHRVRTTSQETSVSIHLLANDTGCVVRHTYDERTGESEPFRSGYANARCESSAEPSGLR
jgi:predicted metal-dependent enzyme (double-stranded beta helix superfamily)